MKSLTLILAMVIVFCVFESVHVRATADNSSHAADAAYQDGAHLGSLAAKRGEEPHVIAGRWSADADRKLFTNGYREAYEKGNSNVQARFVR